MIDRGNPRIHRTLVPLDGKPSPNFDLDTPTWVGMYQASGFSYMRQHIDRPKHLLLHCVRKTSEGERQLGQLVGGKTINSTPRHLATALLLTCLVLVACSDRRAANPAEYVSIDYKMAGEALDWLQLIKDGAGDEEIREYFMTHVASTQGCQSIVHHWARFMEWDSDKFLTFVLEGLGRIEGDGPLENADGSLTALGKRRMLWTSALENLDQLKRDVASLKQMQLTDTAAALAARYLPHNAQLKANFYIVLFGGSSAYSVGGENGFDMLQMPRNDDNSLDVEDALRTFAHELHHTGFGSLVDSTVSDNTSLVGILAAEGAPTYFIDGFPGRADIYARSQNKVQNDVARDWHKHQERLPELYAQAALDIERNSTGEAPVDELFGNWMGGIKGPAYVLGADMYATIDRYLGLDSAKVIIGDYRKLLTIYNAAAREANAGGAECFLFDDSLASRLGRSTKS